jgi:hypothetical protein
MSDTKPKAWLIGAIAIALISGTGFYVARQFMKPPASPSVEVGRAVAEKFLESVRTGKAGEAWDGATAEFKSIEGKESFIQKAKSTPILTGPLQFNSSQSAMVQNEPRAEYLFQSPKAKMVRVLIGNERGDWKVDRLTL